MGKGRHTGSRDETRSQRGRLFASILVTKVVSKRHSCLNRKNFVIPVTDRVSFTTHVNKVFGSLYVSDVCGAVGMKGGVSVHLTRLQESIL